MMNFETENEKITQCMKWLVDFLKCPKPRRVVKGEALKNGFTQQQLKQARKNLKVRLAKLISDDTGIIEDHWFLSLW